jgi:DNA-binding transcriptional ArsR family regulator
VDVFEALADPVRRAILRRLSRGPARVNDLVAEHPVSRPAISRHLRVLREAGLVEADTTGRERPHRLAEGGLTPLRELLTELTAPAPPVGEHLLDGLDLEVRRTTRERTARQADTPSNKRKEEPA